MLWKSLDTGMRHMETSYDDQNGLEINEALNEKNSSNSI